MRNDHRATRPGGVSHPGSSAHDPPAHWCSTRRGIECARRSCAAVRAAGELPPHQRVPCARRSCAVRAHTVRALHAPVRTHTPLSRGVRTDVRALCGGGVGSVPQNPQNPGHPVPVSRAHEQQRRPPRSIRERVRRAHQRPRGRVRGHPAHQRQLIYPPAINSATVAPNVAAAIIAAISVSTHIRMFQLPCSVPLDSV